MTFWGVRAGKHGGAEEYALENEAVVVGWDEMGDLAQLPTKESLQNKLAELHPHAKIGTLRIWAGELLAFRSKIQVGDYACIPLKLKSAVAIGKVVGDYKFDPSAPPGARHQRQVKWIRTDVARTELDLDLKQSLNSTLTVFRVSRNDAERRLVAIANGAASPLVETTDEPLDDSEGSFDFEQYATDEITRYIGEKFHGHDLARLVEAILQAEGYSTELSPPGPDGGVDIIAGTGSLGFGEPRLAVQVKSGKGPIDVTVLRSLRGVMPEFGATHGLIVSWGGFNKAVYSEVRSLYFKVRLWDAGDLIAALQGVYDKLSAEIQSELPLKRTWHLVPQEDD
jgi:restriction system protein